MMPWESRGWEAGRLAVKSGVHAALDRAPSMYSSHSTAPEPQKREIATLLLLEPFLQR